MFKKLRRYLRAPKFALGCDLIDKHPNWMSDRYYVSTLWRIVMGYKLDLRNPKTFNEKLQWLKLYDRNPLYTELVDKLQVKKIIAHKIGAEYIVPTLAIFNSVDDIDLDRLPNQFVLKCNHDSGSVYVCKDKSTFDIDNVKVKLRKALEYNYYNKSREWAYKNIQPCVFAEHYLEDDKFDDLVTYKFLCFSGIPKIMYATVKNDDIWENYYDMQFNQISLQHGRRTSSELLKPKEFEKMKEIASVLSQEMSHVRVDLYEVGGKIFFSEYTFYDWGGLMKFDDNKWDDMLGEMLQLPENRMT